MKIDEKIIRYFEGEMNAEEEEAFRTQIENDAKFLDQYLKYVNMINVLDQLGEKAPEEIMNEVKGVEVQMKENELKIDIDELKKEEFKALVKKTAPSSSPSRRFFRQKTLAARFAYASVLAVLIFLISGDIAWSLVAIVGFILPEAIEFVDELI